MSEEGNCVIVVAVERLHLRRSEESSHHQVAPHSNISEFKETKLLTTVHKELQNRNNPAATHVKVEELH